MEALEPKLVQGQAALFKWKKAQQTSCLGAFSSSEATDHTAWQVKDDLPRGGLGREWEQAQQYIRERGSTSESVGTKPCGTRRECGEVLEHGIAQLGTSSCGRRRRADGKVIEAERHPAVGTLQLEQLGQSMIDIRPVEVDRVGRQMDECRLVSSRTAPKRDTAEFGKGRPKL